MLPSDQRALSAKNERKDALAEWLFVEELPPPNYPAKEVKNVIGFVLKDYGLSDRIQEEEILAAWAQTVGDYLSHQTSPETVRHRTLTIRVNDPAIHYHLQQMYPQLLKKLQERFGAKNIRQIRFKVG